MNKIMKAKKLPHTVRLYRGSSLVHIIGSRSVLGLGL